MNKTPQNNKDKVMHYHTDKKGKKKYILILFTILFLGFIAYSYLNSFQAGQKTGKIFFHTLYEMLKILPFAFILIGLFEVWIKKETVIKHLGDKSGLKGYFWVLILASFTVGGLFTAFPLAESLRRKGASLKVIFAYLGFAAIVRIPMTIFEISFLGLPFTITRLSVTIPLFLLVGIFMGSILDKKGFEFNQGV
jgi:uncharacterized membrane protein YraQ (UPF0718 family)